MKKYYYIISNGMHLKHAIELEQTVPSGDHLYGWSELEVKAGTVSYGVKSVAQITPYPELPEHIKLEVDQLESCDVEAAVSNKRGWMVSDLVENAEADAWDDHRAIRKKGKLDIDFILPGLPRKSVGTLISPGGTGKSMAILQTAAHAVQGKVDFFNASLKKRRVAYISLEDPSEILHNRLVDLYNIPSSNEKNLYDNFMTRSMTLNVAPSKEVADGSALIGLFKVGQEPDLIILDTARRAHQLDENSSGEMTIFLNSLEAAATQLNCAIVILHHTAKGANFAKSQGIDHGSGASRGSSVLVDNARSVWALNVMNKKVAEGFGIDESIRKRYIQLTHEKCNYQRAMDPVWLERDTCGFFTKKDFEADEESEMTQENVPLFKRPKKQRGGLN